MTHDQGYAVIRVWSLIRDSGLVIGHFRALLAVFRRLAQPVSDSAHGVDQPIRIAELFADCGDVDINGAVGDEDIWAHGFVHQLITGEDAATRVDQGGEELELGEREFDRFTFDGGFVLGGVDCERAGTEDAGFSSPGCGSSPRRRTVLSRASRIFMLNGLVT